MKLIEQYDKSLQKIKSQCKSVGKFFSGAVSNESSSSPIIHSSILLGGIALFIFIGGFLLWSVLAPLESGAVAKGKIVVDTNSKEVQHLEGGIVKKMFIDEGSIVKENDPLIELDTIQSKARLEILSKQLYRLLAAEARLIAERDDAEQITWPEQLLELKENPTVAKNIQAQQAIFVANENAMKENLNILQQRIIQIKKQIEAYQAQVLSETKQLELVQEEVAAYEYLDARHLIEKPKYLAAKREAARLIGDRGEHQGLIAQAQEKIGETKQQIIAIQQQELQKTLEELDKTQKDLSDVLEQQIAAQDVFTRTIIRAPVSGTVINLTVHHTGAVIIAGKTFMTIVPSQDRLIVEAEVSPLDIDVVHPGLQAKVRLIAYKQRTSPPVLGTVTLVSPDSIMDEKTGLAHFLVRIEIPVSELAPYPDLKLYPGMPVQVLIIVEKRSPFRYFLQPIIDSFNKAFREE